MVTLVNRAKVNTSTAGTGTITLGSAVDGYQTFAVAGVANGDVVRYVIEDGTGWEIGAGTYTATGSTLTRTVSESSNGGAAISLGGDATVFVSATASDIVQPNSSPTFGSVTVTGTVDGRNVSADGTKLDGIEAGANVTDTANVTAAGALMDSELASVTAVKATTGTFLTADQSKLDGIEAGAKADQTAAQLLTAIKTVDGAGSGLDADRLDALQASDFARYSAGGTLDNSLANTSWVSKYVDSGNVDHIWHDDGNNAWNFCSDTGFKSTGNSVLKAGSVVVTGTVDGRDVASDGTKLDGIETGATADQTAAQLLAKIKTVDVNGSAGINAGTLGGQLPSSAAGNNTIVQRNSSGYIYANYYNGNGTFSTSGTASGMGIFTGTNGTDNFGRSYSAAAARTLLNVENGATADQTAAQLLAKIKTVDVNGSGGINAGRLDGHALTSASTANTVVERNGSGDIQARLFRSEYDTTNAGCEYFMTQVNTGTNNYLRPSTLTQVRTRVVAGAAAGSVGSYVWGLRNVTNTFVSFGTNYAGSQLRPAGFTATAWGVSSTNFTFDDEGGDLSLGAGTGTPTLGGTWRCMGRTSGSSGTGYDRPTTLFLRIS